MTQGYEQNRLQEMLDPVGRTFRIPGRLTAAEEIRMGNINRTYRAEYTDGSGSVSVYLFQCLNTYVFKEPVHLMENIEKVTEHIRKKSPGGPCLQFLYSEKEGIKKNYLIRGEEFWRVSNFIPSVTMNSGTDPEVIRRAGQAFGGFQQMLSDFDASLLYETIPDFHNTEKRYRDLKDAAEKDTAGRRAEALEELSWLLQAEEQACLLTRLGREGALPLRVTHNDTKINNVLFDTETFQPLTVVDLDTVMPGLTGSDFGDAVRSAANYTEEDSTELSKTGINMEIFRAFTEGFLSKTSETLTDQETETLADACFSMTVETAVRFLEDYLRGDVYFRVRDGRHNLERARCQIRLAQDIREHLPEMREIIRTAKDHG